MGRAPCCAEEKGLKKGPWTAEEDDKLSKFIREKGHGSWRALPRLAGLYRCGKSCRLRWMNYLRPDIKRGNFSEEEERLIHFHSIVGNKWAKIAAHLQGRTDNEIKNHWNTHLRKKLLKEGIDPKTHQPITTDHVPYELLVNLITAQSLCGASNLHTNPSSPSMSSSPWEQIIATELARIQLVDNLIRMIGPKAPPAIDCLANTHNATPLLGGSCHNTINAALQSITILNNNPMGNLQQAVDASILSEQDNNLDLPAVLPFLEGKDCREGKGSAPTGSNSFTKSSIGSMDMFEDLENLMVDDTCASCLKDFLE